MGLYDNFPYTNKHELNTDWIVKKIGDIDRAEEASEASAAAAKASEEAAADSQAAAAQSAQSAAGSAQSAQSEADRIELYADQIDLNTARINNIIADGQQTEGNTELIDIRVGNTGTQYTTAGESVRSQADDLYKVIGLRDIDTTVEAGGFNDNGNNYDEPKRCRTKYIPVNHTNRYVISVNTNIRVSISEFSACGVQRINTIGWQQSVIYEPLESTNFIKIAIRNSENTDISVSDVILNISVENIVERISAHSSAIEEIHNVDIDMPTEQGGFNSAGRETSSAVRLRTKFIQVSSTGKYKITMPPGSDLFAFNINFYHGTGDDRFCTTFDPAQEMEITIPENINYIRFLIRRLDNTELVPSDVPYIHIEGSTIKKNIESFINNESSAVSGIVSKTPLRISYSSGSYGSGMCMAGGRLVHFGTSPDDHSEYKNAVVYQGDCVNGFRPEKIITHNFGHMNTVSYNKNNDCLVFGNGSGDYTLAGKFYVYERFMETYLSGVTQFSIADAIEYSDASLNGEVQFNAIWSDTEEGNNQIILITNDNQNLRIIQLGTGSNNLGLGNYIQADTGEYNGSFKVQKLCTQNVGEIGPNQQTQSAKYCVQDAEYRNGYIYAGIGHNHYEIWKMKMLDDGSIEKDIIRKHFYNDDGTENNKGVSALEVTNQFMIVHNTDNYFYVYVV